MPEAISTISRHRISSLYPGLRPLAYRVLQDCLKVFGIPMNMTDAYRSMDEQFSVYKQGREFSNGTWIVTDPKSIVSNARPGLSFHNYGLSFDNAFSGGDPYLEKKPQKEFEQMWQQYGNIVIANGMNWGGNFRLKNGTRDRPHAEMSYGLQIHECLELYTQGGLEKVWNQIDEIRGVPIGQGL